VLPPGPRGDLSRSGGRHPALRSGKDRCHCHIGETRTERVCRRPRDSFAVCAVGVSLFWIERSGLGPRRMPIFPYHAYGLVGRRLDRLRRATRAGMSRRAVVLLLPALFLVAACSTESRYRVLCLFIDGVPPLPAVTAGEPKPGAPTDQPPARQWSSSVHKPYAEFQCAKCHNVTVTGGGVPHGQDFVIMRPEEGLCASCHKTMPGKPQFAHAPVLHSACLWCHLPHESAYPALLRGPPAEVCFRCHWEAELSTGAHHPRPLAASERSCIDCHTAHGGEQRFFLKPPPGLPPAPASGVAPADAGTHRPNAGQTAPVPRSAASPAAPPS
jgi:predicted CXXCH cytochrome family protein